MKSLKSAMVDGGMTFKYKGAVWLFWPIYW